MDNGASALRLLPLDGEGMSVGWGHDHGSPNFQPSPHPFTAPDM